MATIGFEEKLWQAADKLRGSMDAAEYKNVALGIIFLKYVSDSFEEKYEELLNDEYADEEDKDEYLAENIFWVPKEARWQYINDNSKKPEIGQIIDKAMIAIERENESLKGVLPKDYARPSLDKEKLGSIIDLFTFNVGDSESKKQDILGRVYEYFIAKFASAEGKMRENSIHQLQSLNYLLKWLNLMKVESMIHVVGQEACLYKVNVL